jgi:hypothetical protein
MKSHTSFLIASLVAVTALVGCGNDDPNELLAGGGRTPQTVNDEALTAGGEGNSYNHIRDSVGGENGITDLHARKLEELTIGTPEDVARLHGAQKISYGSLGSMLGDFGVSLQAGAKGSLSAGTLYTGGRNALGAPIYTSRTPEMLTPSTSALAKQMDIFVAAAPDIVTNIGNSKRCPGVKLLDTNNQFTKDGIACLTGKPTSDAYLQVANQMLTDVGDPTKGPQIAVATILAAQHISE